MTAASGQGADVVVAGGGIRGVCIAYYLARAGVGVTLVEKGFLGSGASSANTGLVNVSQKVPGHYTLFSLLSGDMYPEFITKGRTGLPIAPYGLSRFTAADLEWMREPIKGAVRH